MNLYLLVDAFPRVSQSLLHLLLFTDFITSQTLFYYLFIALGDTDSSLPLILKTRDTPTKFNDIDS